MFKKISAFRLAVFGKKEQLVKLIEFSNDTSLPSFILNRIQRKTILYVEDNIKDLKLFINTAEKGKNTLIGMLKILNVKKLPITANTEIDAIDILLKLTRYGNDLAKNVLKEINVSELYKREKKHMRLPDILYELSKFENEQAMDALIDLSGTNLRAAENLLKAASIGIPSAKNGLITIGSHIIGSIARFDPRAVSILKEMMDSGDQAAKEVLNKLDVSILVSLAKTEPKAVFALIDILESNNNAVIPALSQMNISSLEQIAPHNKNALKAIFFVAKFGHSVQAVKALEKFAFKNTTAVKALIYLAFNGHVSAEESLTKMADMGHQMAQLALIKIGYIKKETCADINKPLSKTEGSLDYDETFFTSNHMDDDTIVDISENTERTVLDTARISSQETEDSIVIKLEKSAYDGDEASLKEIIKLADNEPQAILSLLNLSINGNLKAVESLSEKLNTEPDIKKQLYNIEFDSPIEDLIDVIEKLESITSAGPILEVISKNILKELINEARTGNKTALSAIIKRAHSAEDIYYTALKKLAAEGIEEALNALREII